MEKHPRIIDTHVHLDAETYDVDRVEVLTRARAAGIEKFICVGAGYGIMSASRAIALAERHTDIYASAGIHPHDAADTFDRQTLKQLAHHPRCVAIGETGLDFVKSEAPTEKQKEAFQFQIELALETTKPLIIHARGAARDCLEMLRPYQGKLRAVFHCYSEDEHFARELAALNFLISIPGFITFKKSEETRRIVSQIPLSQIMLETDGPYIAPEPFRGKRCESAWMVETAKAIAACHATTLEHVAQVTSQTANDFFRI